MNKFQARNRAVRRKVVARLLSQVQAPERRYVRDLRVLFQDYHRKVTDGLDYARIARQDAVTILHSQVAAKEVGLVPALKRAAIPLFDRMAEGIRRTNAHAMRLTGVAYSDVGVTETVAVFRARNLELVEKAGREFADQLMGVFEDPDIHGLRVEEVAARIAERASVSVSRAELIARDQTLRLNRQITMVRHQSAGVSSFQWSTSQDERVRDTHVALEGQVFPWSAPPPEFSDVQCRCVQIPILPDSDEE